MNEEKKLPEEKEIKGHPPSPEPARESQNPQGEKNEPAEPANTQSEPDKTQAQKQGRRFLTFYIIALFSIALVLIGMSYVTQVKANRLNSQLTEQTTAAQGAKAKAEKLQALVADQQKTIEEYNKIFGVEKDQTAADARKILDEKNQALDYLWRLEKNYQKDQWESCRQIIDQMETAYGNQLQDREKGVLTGVAWDEYQTIRQAVAGENAEQTEN